jgi:hypothetical protein
MDIGHMDGLPKFFDLLKKKGLVKGHFLGFLNVTVGRRISHSDGTLLSAGMAWREIADWLRKVRWDPDDAKELSIDTDGLPPRDRYRYWYHAIAQAGLDSQAACKAGDQFAKVLREQGYEVGPAPKLS